MMGVSADNPLSITPHTSLSPKPSSTSDDRTPANKRGEPGEFINECPYVLGGR